MSAPTNNKTSLIFSISRVIVVKKVGVIACKVINIPNGGIKPLLPWTKGSPLNNFLSPVKLPLLFWKFGITCHNIWNGSLFDGKTQE
ncbi:MAG TPA: hypothetical protein VKR58_01585, partial [Aquella sp.]|nr:hypothetical protein [Aquella sp.]